MFKKHHHRTSWPSAPLTAATANPNATSAARAASQSQSAAAASAALKSHPAQPTNVAAVQTTRTLRRSASVSSTHSLGRRGSLVERSLRSRSPSPHGSSRPDDPDIPPVPDLPVAKNPRPHSLQLLPSFKVASGQPMEEIHPWYTAAAIGDLSNVRTADAPMFALHTNPLLVNPQPQARLGNVSPSVNFSYPRLLSSPDLGPHEATRRKHPVSHRPSQQQQSTITDPTTMVFDPNSRRLVSKADLMAQEMAAQAIRDAAAAERASRRVRQQEHSRSGSHVAKGTVARTNALVAHENLHTGGSRASSKANTPTPDRRPATDAPQIIAPQVSRPAQLAPEVLPYLQDNTSLYLDISPSPEPDPALSMMPTPIPQATMPVIQDEHYPEFSILSGEYQPEAHELPDDPNAAARRDSLLRLEGTATQHELSGDPKAAVERSGLHRIDPGAARRVAVHPVGRSSSQSPIELEAKGFSMLDSPSESGQSTPEFDSRTDGQPPPPGDDSPTPNHSPSKSTHFGLATHLPARYSHPTRSLSPRKSALKHVSPSRGVLGSDDSSEASREDSAVLPRKKAVHVSFNEGHTVVGESAPQSDSDSSPPPPDLSGVAKSRWYQFSRQRRDPGQAEEDEPMAPRPVLPFFSSIRQLGSKIRESDDRPLVRPREPSPSSPLKRFSSDPLGHSSDDTLGGSQIREPSLGNEPKSSCLEPGEPVPPVVTSVEGPAYISHSSSSSSEEGEEDKGETLSPSVFKAADSGVVIDEGDAQNDAADFATIQPASAPAQTPAILDQSMASVPKVIVSPATPGPEKQHYDHDVFVIPGQFPSDDDEGDGDEGQAQRLLQKPSFALAVVAAVPKSPAVTAALPTSIPVKMNGAGGESDSDRSSIYSDAYEDISDADADGFMSLDAVVTMPLNQEVSQTIYNQTLTAAPQRDTATAPNPATGTAGDNSRTAGEEDDWEKVKAYWKGLSAEKRKQLEQEALQEAGEDADLEGAAQVATKKPRKKKSVERRAAEAQQVQSQILLRASSDRVNQISSSTSTEPQRGSKLLHSSSVSATPAQHQQTLEAAQPDSSKPRKPKRREGDPIESGQAGRDAQKLLRPTAAIGASGTAVSGSRAPRHNERNGSVTAATKAVGQPVNTPSPSQVMAAALMKTSTAAMRRRGSDSSESSFTRLRPRASPNQLGFRRSMRGVATAADVVGLPSSPTSLNGNAKKHRFSLRSMSPPGSPTLKSSPPVSMETMGAGGMRRTLRTPTPEDGRRHMRIPSLSRGKPAKFKSRFGDSSSDDDDERAAALVPTKPTTPSSLIASTTKTTPASGSRAGAGQHTRRSSLMSVLRRKKADPPGTIHKISRSYGESAARLDTDLERTASELSVLRRRGSQNREGWPLRDEHGQREPQESEDENERQDQGKTPTNLPERRGSSARTVGEVEVPQRRGGKPNRMLAGLKKVFGLGV